MSLINQMLQDLDKRRAAHGVGSSLPNDVRPLPQTHASRLPVVLGSLVFVGLLAGFLASVVALLVGWGLARYVFDFNWTGSWTVPVLGSLAGAVLALSAGWWGLRAVLNTPVVETLRKSQ